ncbi:G-type lectin S-receptor-like serine/threonine-protein kinase RLK1 [Olea europaea var. sylvestris]|uniref:G-type lectin S-receptor-like serine/threonine-protein kinase RLK1 n=1 Tax=Olea europaea var. sylvestris TaxID=158386 RepID=UPI000C1D3919|nr:G-type lectin S-receptor-like serine/threonine-protein kinase RLK1 [Olea europaea var. sylvestris]
MAYALFNSIFLIIFLLPLCAFSQNNGTITVGTSIVATERSTPWLSPSGDFAFGFQKLQSNDMFQLAIWYDKIPNKTVVWYPNVTNPISGDSTVGIDAQNGLVLRDPQGRVLWSTIDIVDDVSHGFLNDTGNFVLVRSDSVSIWESFNYPSDTLLPTQIIAINDTLVSRKSETNFSRGRFYLRMLSDGNLVLNTRSVPTNSDFDDEYYNSQSSDPANASNSGYQLVFNERGSLYVLRRNGERTDLTTKRSIPTTSDHYYRAILDFDGVFRTYYYPRSSSGDQEWTVAEYWPLNICMEINGQKGSGACGYNSVCRLENGKPICECPLGFYLSEPNDPFSDCNPKFIPICGEDDQKGSAEDVYEMSEVSDTDWPFSDFEQLAPFTENDCKNACLNDCLCAVSIYRNNSCWKKKLPLSNGRLYTAINAKAFFKFRKGNIPVQGSNFPTPEKKKKDRGTLILVGSVLLGSSLFVNFMFVGAACLGFFLIYNKKITNFRPVHDTGVVNLRCFTYKELAQATDGFKEELGRGAFGIVYKGVMPTGSNSTIAVKKLDRVAQDTEKEFKTEVNVIGQTHHKNLVRLLGFCEEGPHRMLVYEYMNNGTLASFLFGDLKPNWNRRIQIARGIARGLAYLHEECSTQIIHCDIKPQNILLDEYFNARISDFGLAKLLMMNQSRTLTNIRGTKGYVAPEWFRNTQVTVKVDVYSFGVLLLEIITCRKSLIDLEFGEGENPILTDWVWDCFQDGTLDTLVKNDTEALNDKKRLETFVMVGIWCIQEDSSLRPTMRKVSQMLEGTLEVNIPPCPSPFA